jgi:predicted ATPase with chaperone activity
MTRRSLFRMLRVARTLADLDESPRIREMDIGQAWEWQAEQSARARGEHISGI